MILNQFVKQNQLRPADAIVLRKKFMGMVDHYAIYLGDNPQSGSPEFVANFTKGVQIIPEKEIVNQLKTYVPKKIERFEGTTHQRRRAIERAWLKIGDEAYNLLGNNCEHFKNWVHHGKEISEQVNKAGNISAVLGTGVTIAGLVSNNNKNVFKGLGLLTLGLILKNLSKKE
ncbi:lecithin retinol acyltransferase family protein [Tenacibaculum maritimum]|uniref:lecithin retinol acyltransferase family protein n=1 Tax=Tenacibaculum maritimum TaxID=107401 RepID=UPI0012E435BB|nr:lecithin retinol acyltransferase family protein [Tenacibaculum maritimum]CAA0151492.1 conserved hypothetical protein [Tenacibaculum maritimum]CAA0154983.1 conserved hypothetical protein [Tenacibaculum maritimum]CAA0155539.1 conserved hypothetical protein [Tenacibaculum maritimum]CAA0245218.1 conserved hypothetical protein [Tenacibaculum maritimum]